MEQEKYIHSDFQMTTARRLAVNQDASNDTLFFKS